MVSGISLSPVFIGVFGAVKFYCLFKRFVREPVQVLYFGCNRSYTGSFCPVIFYLVFLDKTIVYTHSDKLLPS